MTSPAPGACQCRCHATLTHPGSFVALPWCSPVKPSVYASALNTTTLALYIDITPPNNNAISTAGAATGAPVTSYAVWAVLADGSRMDALDTSGYPSPVAGKVGDCR